MPHYKYTALLRSGEKVSGMMDGLNEMDAAARIRESCDVILKLTEVGSDKPGLLNMELGSHLNGKAFSVMCSQFAIILDAGIPIARAVKLVAEKTVDKKLRTIMDKVAQDVEGGKSLSNAFEEHGGKLLPVTFVETLRAGESTGNLGAAFGTVHEQYDKQEKMRSKVRGALAYPMFVLTIAVGVVAVLMIVVVPKFTDIFAEMGGELPLITRLLIGISNFFAHYFWIMLIVAAALFIAYKAYNAAEKGRDRLAQWQLRLPVLGRIAELNAASQFANTMSSLIGAGLTMDRAVAITARVIDNYHLSRQTAQLAEALEAGKQLGPSMHDLTDYPDILIDMASVGEGSGEMEKTLRVIGRYYDNELEEATKSALAKLEPALLVGLAGLAGFIVIAIYMAMFSMYGTLGNL